MEHVQKTPVYVQQLGVWVGQKSLKLLKKFLRVLWAMVKDPRIISVWCSDIWKATVHTVRWVVNGSKLFKRNFTTCGKLVSRSVRGHPLTFREHKLLVRTVNDCFKLVPFSFFIIIPFAELLLPIALKLFPNLLPSTFFEKEYDHATLSRKLKAKAELAGFFQEVVSARTKELLQGEGLHKEKAQELQDFQNELLASTDGFANPKKVIQFGKMFAEEFKLENMKLEHLQIICRMLGISPYGMHPHVVLQLRYHMVSLRREDREILWEGVDNLDHVELIEACRARAMRFHGVTDDQMRVMMRHWLELSSHKDIPITLLLWSRTFFITQGRIGLESDKMAEVPQEETVESEKEVFKQAAEKSQQRVVDTERRLEELQKELQMINLESKKKEEMDALSENMPLEKKEKKDKQVIFEEPRSPYAVDEEVHNYSEYELSQMEKSRLVQRMRAGLDQLELHRDIIKRQNDMLQVQMQFLAEMREFKFTKDDARVTRKKLNEMFVSWEKDLKTIDQVITESNEMASSSDLEDTSYIDIKKRSEEAKARLCTAFDEPCKMKISEEMSSPNGTATPDSTSQEPAQVNSATSRPQ